MIQAVLADFRNFRKKALWYSASPSTNYIVGSGQLGAQLSPVSWSVHQPSSPRTAQRRATSTGPKTSVEVLIGPGKFDHYTSHHEWINFGKNEFGICKVISSVTTENHWMLPMFIVPTFASSDDTDIVSIQMCPKCKQLTEGFKRFSQSPRWRKLKHYREINVLSTTTTVTLQWRFEQILYASNSYG